MAKSTTLKVYTWQAFIPQAGQVHCFVAATSRTEVGRLNDAPATSLFNLADDFGHDGIREQVLAQPGVVFWQPINAYDGNVFISERHREIKARLDGASVPAWLAPGVQVLYRAGERSGGDGIVTVESVKGRKVTLSNGKTFDGTRQNPSGTEVYLGATYRAGHVCPADSDQARAFAARQRRDALLAPVNTALDEFRTTVSPATARAAASALLALAETLESEGAR